MSSYSYGGNLPILMWEASQWDTICTAGKEQNRSLYSFKNAAVFLDIIELMTISFFKHINCFQFTINTLICSVYYVVSVVIETITEHSIFISCHIS